LAVFSTLENIFHHFFHSVLIQANKIFLRIVFKGLYRNKDDGGGGSVGLTLKTIHQMAVFQFWEEGLVSSKELMSTAASPIEVLCKWQLIHAGILHIVGSTEDYLASTYTYNMPLTFDWLVSRAHSESNSPKKCNLGKPHFLPQSL